VNYIILGVTGFLAIHLFDIFALKRWPLAKPLSWFLGVGLLVYATFMACLSTDKLALPNWVIWLGWPIMFVSVVILINSLFLNLPFKKTYIEKGNGSRLVISGFYALVRHPWFHGFFLIMISLILLTGSELMLYAFFVWVPLVIIFISIQDRFLFRRMFPDYDSYSKNTPMLIPNKKSIRAFISQLKDFRIEILKNKEA